MNYKAVLFDFDYTLGDATEAIVAGFTYAFREMGLPIPDRDSIRGTVGLMLEDAYTILYIILIISCLFRVCHL